jgi:uncharacterized protein (DUF1330 family)
MPMRRGPARAHNRLVNPFQEVIMPKGYAIFTLDVRDQARLFEYIEAATPSILEAGGNLVVAGAPDRVLEGEWHGNRTAILEFPTVEAAQRWYDCAEYQTVIGIRHEAAESNGVIIAGFELPADQSDAAGERVSGVVS